MDGWMDEKMRRDGMDECRAGGGEEKRREEMERVFVFFVARG